MCILWHGLPPVITLNIKAPYGADLASSLRRKRKMRVEGEYSICQSCKFQTTVNESLGSFLHLMTCATYA